MVTDNELRNLLARQAAAMETLAGYIKEVKEKEAGDLKTKAPATTGNATPLHGRTRVGAGIFTTAGLEREIISTHVRPMGIGSVLPAYPTINLDPRFGALTGVSDDIGNEPATPCDDAPTGYIKSATLTAQFGLIQRKTATLDIREVRTKLHRGDFTDLRLVGELFGLTDLEPSGLGNQEILNIMTAAEMVNTGVRFERKLAKMIWQGNIANNNAGGGYKEFPGLDSQIATGQVDADTNVAVPSLDSDVKNFNYDLVGGSGRDIVEYISMIEFFITTLAMQTGVEPVNHVFVMRPELWQELTAVWPIAYNTNKGVVLPTNNYVFVNGRDNIMDRDAMRRARTIEVNGRSYPVLLDTGIYEKNNTTTAGIAAGQYASSIYFLPLTMSGMPVTYMEYKDYRVVGDDLRFLNGTEQFWTDQGRYMWASEYKKFCYDIQGSVEPRVVLRTPHLAGRIDNVKYQPLQHLRDADPESVYFANGGVSYRQSPTFSAIWN